MAFVKDILENEKLTKERLQDIGECMERLKDIGLKHWLSRIFFFGGCAVEATGLGLLFSILVCFSNVFTNNVIFYFVYSVSLIV